MHRFYLSAVLAALALLDLDGQVLAASSNVPQTPEKTVPQGSDPPGADNDAQSAPTTKHKGVIKPPQTGDQRIYTQVPNPNAGTKKEVIPPPGTPGSEDPNLEPR